MLRYEVLFFTAPEITNDEAVAIENQLEQQVSEAKGKVISFERWGKYRLPYQVRHNEYAVYFLFRFEVSNESKLSLLKALEHLFSVKNSDLVMRHVVTKLDINQPLDYIRPDALDEAISHNVDDFLKENNMSSFVQKNAGHPKNEEEIELEILEQ